VLEEALLQDTLGAEFAAAVNDDDLAGEIGEEERFLNRGIATADDDILVVALKEPIAGGAGGDAKALEFLFAGNAEPLGLGAGSDDQSVAGIDGAAIAMQLERSHVEVNRDDEIVENARADMFGLRLHLLQEPGALDDIGIAGVIFDIGGDGELAAGLHALDDNGLKHGARCIDCRGVTGRAGPDDDDFGVHRDAPAL
jgi:hypothetical protein